MQIITLTTDFGVGSYVAEMKGAILSIESRIHLVDVTHAIPPQDVRSGALALRQIERAFPAGTVHVAVIDPGVGTGRRILLVEAHDQWFIAPDNGLLTFPLELATEIRVVDRPRFWRAKASATFHGRDVMGPVAAHLCRGISADEISSSSHQEPIRLDFSRPEVGSDAIVGQVTSIDHFGNLITNIRQNDLSAAFPQANVDVLLVGKTIPLQRTYADTQPNEVLALIGSSGWLEVAVCCGDASKTLRVSVGAEVSVVHAAP